MGRQPGTLGLWGQGEEPQCQTESPAHVGRGPRAVTQWGWGSQHTQAEDWGTGGSQRAETPWERLFRARTTAQPCQCRATPHPGTATQQQGRGGGGAPCHSPRSWQPPRVPSPSVTCGHGSKAGDRDTPKGRHAGATPTPPPPRRAPPGPPRTRRSRAVAPAHGTDGGRRVPTALGAGPGTVAGVGRGMSRGGTRAPRPAPRRVTQSGDRPRAG